MSSGYQFRDACVVDYQLWQASADGEQLRGPPPPDLRPGSYFACVGAAQTFGCFVAHPWPALLAARIGLPALNLGVAGAGPALFRTPQFAPLLAGARFVVFQVLSARSADCTRFASGGRERLLVRAEGRTLGADAAWSEFLRQDLAAFCHPLLRRLVNRWFAWSGRADVRAAVQQTRADWLAQFTALLAATPVPKVLFWWSRRAPRYRPRFHSVAALFGEYPQLVDNAMVAGLAAFADAYVECVTARGCPQLLRDRETGAPVTVRPADAGTGEDPDVSWTHNTYYPSPEMHEDAAAALQAATRALADRTAPASGSAAQHGSAAPSG